MGIGRPNLRALRQGLAKPAASTWNESLEDRVIRRASGEPVAYVRPAREQWQLLVDEIMERQNLDRDAALKVARSERPDLLERMRREANAGSRR